MIFENMTRSPLNRSDNSMKVFMASDYVLRVVDTGSVSLIRKIFESGLIAELMDAEVIAKINIVQNDAKELILRQELIAPIVYPYEWSPEMLRAAALCTLKVNLIANKYGFELKDAGPYNIVFKHNKPLHVDVGSFIQLKHKEFWCAEQEFVNCYHRSLKLAESGMLEAFRHAFVITGNGSFGAEQVLIGNFFLKLLGVDLAKRLLKYKAFYKNSLVVSEEKIFHKTNNAIAAKILSKLFKSSLLPFRKYSYEWHYKKIKNYSLDNATSWGDYHEESGFYENNFSTPERFSWVLDKIHHNKISTVIELAGNQGVLSREISRIPFVKSIICTDYDQSAVNKLFNKNKIAEANVAIACMDFMHDAKEELTHERAKRLRSELVIALAVTHHLILTQNYSLATVLITICSYTEKYAVIEFMPKGLWDGVDAPEIPIWYTEEWFESGLNEFFEIKDKLFSEVNRVTYFLEKK